MFPAINRIFYLFKRVEAFESTNITNLVLSILVSFKRPYRYSQNVELENCRMYSFLKFYIQFLLSFVYPYILKSWSFWRCHTKKSSPKHGSLALFNRFCIHRLCITGKLSDVQCWFFLTCILLTRKLNTSLKLNTSQPPTIRTLSSGITRFDQKPYSILK